VPAKPAKPAKPVQPTPYFTMSSQNPKRMLLGTIPDPSFDDSWLYGRKFVEEPSTPIRVPILKGYAKAEPLDYFGTPPVMSDRFYEALKNAGVDNLDVYDAVLVSSADNVIIKGYKAFNVIGLVEAADLKATKFSPANPSRLIDASIDSLAIDPKKAKGLLLFRLAEYAGAVIVHASLKSALERANFPYLVFSEPKEFIS